MSQSFEVPDLADLAELPVHVKHLEEPWIVAVTSSARDGDVVTVTWDEIARSVSLLWKRGPVRCLTLEREGASRVAIHGEGDRIRFLVESGTADFSGQMEAHIGEMVTISDAFLQV